MDFIILKSDGSLQKQSLTRYIQQGSHGVDEIFIGWANATSSHILQAVFTLPNKLTNTELGTFVSDYEYEPGETINGWVITLTENQTRYNGLLMVSARIILNGIVQVAYPFALCINETGVRPETDSGVTLEQLDSYLLNLQTLVTGAVQQNTDATLSNTSENPVQNKVITNALENFKKDSYKKVDTTEYPTLQDFLDSEGEEGYLYLYPIDPSDESAGFYRYIWEDDAWVSLGTTVIDLSNMVTTDTNQTITAPKTIKNTLNFVDATETSSVVNSIKTDQYGGMAFLRAGLTAFAVGGADVRFSNRHLLPNANNTTYNLGASNSQWKDLYLSGKYYLESDKYIYLDSSNRVVISNNSDRIKIGADGIVSFVANVVPLITASYDLGGSSHYWRNLYLSGKIYLKDTTGTGTAEIDVNNNSDIQFKAGSKSNAFIIGSSSMRCGVNLLPAYNENKTIGLDTDAYRWNGLYLKPSAPMSDGSASRSIAGLCGKTGAPTVSSNTAELPYDTFSELTLSANTTVNLQTAPTGCYPEYKAIITASASITLTFTGVSNFLTNDEDNVVITNGTNTTVALASGTTVEISIVNGKGVAINFGA